MFSRIAIRLTLLNTGTMLALLAGVLVAVFFSVKISLERDSLSDLRTAATAATSFAEGELVPPVNSSAEESSERFRIDDDDDDDDDHDDDDDRRRGPVVGPDSSTTDLDRAVPVFIVDSSGQLIVGSADLVAGLPDYESIRASSASSDDVRMIDSEHGPVRVLSRSVIVNGAVVGTLQVGTSVSAEQRVLTVLIVVVAIVGGVAAISVGAAGYFLSTSAMRPIRLAFTRQQEFIADAAHELRTPVAVISADADALVRVLEQLPEEDRRLLEDLQRESRFIGDVVGKLLQVARLDAGAEATAPSVFDLRELTSDVAGAMSLVAKTEGVTIESAGVGSAVHVVADRVQIRLVLMSVLDNAIKYNVSEGSVRISVDSSVSHGIVEIRDTGAGIAPEDVERVFTRFYRVDRARSRGAGGVGLGLSIAMAVMESNRGSLSLRSTIGEGTTVEMSLPSARGI